MATWEVIHGDCLDVMAGMRADSVDTIITDPPYFRVKNEPWDRQWSNPAEFIAWLGAIIEQWHRVLRPNGSLYVFASPRMAARVELAVGEAFNVLNSIVWAKPKFSTKAEMFDKDTCRAYLPVQERIIFAEHYGADNIAKGEAGYVAKCDELRGFVFEPIRAYLDGERIRAGLTREQVREECGKKLGTRGKISGHWYDRAQWMFPTEEWYQWLRETFTRMNGGGEYLRREYEDLRREYEDLRRPFNVTPDVPYTDVWAYPTVSSYPGKHPCEKPVEMLRHMIEASTRPDALVLDCFAGTGSTGIACVAEGRSFIGVEIDASYVEIARRRIEAAAQQTSLFVGGGGC